MNLTTFIDKACKHPEKIVTNLGRRGLLNWMTDETYIKLLYYAAFRKKLNLSNPQTFNEKLQWLKLYDRNPLYTTLVDKYEAKKYVAEIIGDEHIIPTLGVWENFDDIDFSALPNQFVLKCTHDSGGLVICKDKDKLNIQEAKNKINKSLRQNFFYFGREWPYKNVKPRIMAETYMEDGKSGDLRDYKFFCFGGLAKCFKIDFDRFIEHHANYYDRKKNLLSLGEEDCPPVFDRELTMPGNYDLMLQLAEKLSEEKTFLRADFYDVNNEVYFGELTFYPASGIGKLLGEWDIELGQWIQLPTSVGGYSYLTSEFVVWFMPDQKNKNNGLTDYKFYTFNGEAKYCQVISNRFKHETIDFFDMNWKHMEFTGLSNGAVKSKFPPCSPVNFKEMKKIVDQLAMEVPFLRVDLYDVNGSIYFGELTFYPNTGLGTFYPEEWNNLMGENIVLSL